jgi:hypothetical protein
MRRARRRRGRCARAFSPRVGRLSQIRRNRHRGLIRAIDFATREQDGAILIAFTQTDLRSAHVVARRIAGLWKTAMLRPLRAHAKVTANVTLATLKACDTPEGLFHRVLGSRMVAAE